MPVTISAPAARPTARKTPKAAAKAPKVRDASVTKSRILDCAIQEFADHGYDGARIERIVKQADVNVSLAYQYFGSKENLFIAVMEQAYDLMRANHRDFDIRGLEPMEAMESLVRWTFQIFVKNPQLIGLLNSENVQRGRHIAKSTYIRGLYNPLLDTIETVLKRGAKEKVFRDDVKAEDLFISMNGMGYFYLSNRFTLGVILGRDLMKPSAIRHHEEHIVQVLLGYLRR
ncbi:TetR/AcrR family transcriptional regulator [Variovorax sp. VNK109]|uniref:TetR/AcrR family transcriptional regulator n=1 Tax=Variovorax sp. VNK109 TaxID=3400919 RepID=UPI003C0439E5